MVRRKIKLIFFIVIIFIIICSKQSYGFVKTDYKKDSIILYMWVGTTTEDIWEDLQTMGYYGNSTVPTKEMKLKTMIIVTEADNKKGKYKIKINAPGNGMNIVKVRSRSIKYKELKTLFGMDDSVKQSDIKVGDSWPVNIIVGASEELDKGTPITDYHIWLEQLYAGSQTDMDKIDSIEIDETEEKASNADLNNKIANTIGAVTSWIDDWLQNPVGKSVSTIMDLIRDWIADAIQWWASIPQTWADGTYSDWTVTYKYDDLKKDGEGENIQSGKKNIHEDSIGKRDRYTKVGEYNAKSDAKASIDISKDENPEYEKDTEIPVMVGDIYNIAVNHMDFLDANFLTGNKEKSADKKTDKHSENSTWTTLRNFIAVLTHAIIYVVSGLLILILIYNGIQIVIHSMDNPMAKAEHKKAIEHFGSSVAMLIGSVLVMTLCISLGKAIVSNIEVKDSYELPIRVNVENAGYSFSTTVAGYARYLAAFDDFNLWLKKMVNVIAYLGYAILNFIAVYGMLFRIFIIGYLTVIGPLISVTYAFKGKPFMKFSTWVTMYATIYLLPIIFLSGTYTFLLKTIS